ncbi:MAG TPA: helix-turn-helix domain-containing protein [Terracidiphilus sp.]|nr:helix-turn-helix domain-containing protein [Terracidiphilus sp.]
MPASSLNKQQLRTRETHARLLDAAEKIFVGQGYEGAQLSQIAAAAGRTKGAVYAHFRSKEDLFLALFAQRTRAYVARLLAAIETCTTRPQRLRAFREFFISLAANRTWPILELEFKLFALRHPESRQRLRQAFAASLPQNDDALYAQVFGPLSRTRRAQLDLAATALGPIVSGLILESHIEPQKLSEPNLRLLFGQIFDALFPVPA